MVSWASLKSTPEARAALKEVDDRIARALKPLEAEIRRLKVQVANLESRN